MRARRWIRYAAYRAWPALAFRFDPFRTRSNRANLGGNDSESAKIGLQDRVALVAEAKRMRDELRGAGTIERMVEILHRSKVIRSDQIPIEIASLLRIVQNRRPSCLCEIGAAGGGTLALFSRVADPKARILSIDINYPEAKQAAYTNLLEDEQQLTCVEGDSHSEHVAATVKAWLNGRRIEFLFIDGDHTYEGVKADYELYSPLVASKGIIAFHDIVNDYRTRYGIDTQSFAAGVPRFWKEIAGKETTKSEFVEHPWQDGYGIGVIVKR
jgi:predicted O-methyltransferase YrrM